MKLRKCLALFLAAALMISSVPQKGGTVSASEKMDEVDVGEGNMAEDSNSELGGIQEASNEQGTESRGSLETSEGMEAVDEEDAVAEDSPEEQIRENVVVEDPSKEQINEGVEMDDIEEISKDVETSETLRTQDGDIISIEENEGTESTGGVDGQGKDALEKITVSESEESYEIISEKTEEKLETQAGDIASGIDGDITWRIDGDGRLTVNGTGDRIYGYWPWEEYKEQIISAEISMTGMTVADRMFEGCSNLNNLDLSNLDTSNITNMYGMFSGCSNLSSLDLSTFNTANVANMNFMFNDCSSLSSLDLNSFDTTNVTEMHGMFLDCSKLSSLDLSGFDTSNVTLMSVMFGGCSSLGSLNLNTFNTSNVIDMRGMFNNCSNLDSLDLSNFNTSNVIDMSSMFWGCSNLTSLDLSGFNTINVITMEHMFFICNNLSNLNISSFDTTNVTDMNAMFDGCSNLNSLDLSNFNTSNVINMSFMFGGCSNLTSLDLSGFNTSSLEIMTYMFHTCSSLKDLNLSSFDTSNVTAMDEVFLGCCALNTLDLRNFDFFKVTDAPHMFKGCSNLSTIYTPYNINLSIILPLELDMIWFSPDGTEITQLPQNLNNSIMIVRRKNPKITTTTHDLNMDDVIRVKYVPYSYTVKTNNWDEDNKVTFSLEKGKLAEGLQIYPDTGEIYGVPMEAGQFPITVKATYSDPQYVPSYADLTLTVIDNTDDNVLNASDEGYEVEQYIGSQIFDSADSFYYAVTESTDQLFVSAGAYTEFIDFWLNGRRLVEGEDYTKESGSTRITIRKQTLEGKASQNGTNTIAAEFRVGGDPNNDLKRTAQNFRMEIQSGGSEENDSGSGSGRRDRESSSGSGHTGTGDGTGYFVTSVVRLVNSSGTPLPDTVLELHSTPQESRTDRNGIAIFSGVESGLHTLYAKDGNGNLIASKSFELLFGDNTWISGDQITVKAGAAFTLNVQVDGEKLKFLSIQEGDLYQVISAATSDDASPEFWFLVAALSVTVATGICSYGRKRKCSGRAL